MKKITPKQKRFCEEYVIDLNGTQAAIRAGYSEKTANEQASRLLAKVNIKAYVEELQAEIKERNALKLDDVIEELRKIGFVSIEELYNEDGSLKEVHEMSDRAKASISSVKVTQKSFGDDDAVETTKEVKLWDKKGALTDLARHLGGFKEDNSQKAPVNNIVVENNVIDRVADKIKEL